MQKRIQTWSTVKNGVIKSYEGQTKSFEQYSLQVKTEKLVQQAYVDHLLSQLAQASQAPVVVADTKSNEQILKQIESLKMSLNPISKFFDNGHQAVTQKKRLSKKDKEKLEDEAQIQKMELASLQRLKKKGIV